MSSTVRCSSSASGPSVVLATRSAQREEAALGAVNRPVPRSLFGAIGALTLTAGRGPHSTTTPRPAIYLAKASTSAERAGTRMIMKNTGMKQKTMGKIIFVWILAAFSSTRWVRLSRSSAAWTRRVSASGVP
jgi:hypothetical protein